jgi:hypothetical protein
LTILYIKATCLFVCLYDKQGKAGVVTLAFPRGRAAKADTRPLFSVTNRAGAGQGGQGRHPPAVFSYRQGRARQGRARIFLKKKIETK